MAEQSLIDFEVQINLVGVIAGVVVGVVQTTALAQPCGGAAEIQSLLFEALEDTVEVMVMMVVVVPRPADE